MNLSIDLNSSNEVALQRLQSTSAAHGCAAPELSLEQLEGVQGGVYVGHLPLIVVVILAALGEVL